MFVHIYIYIYIEIYKTGTKVKEHPRPTRTLVEKISCTLVQNKNEHTGKEGLQLGLIANLARELDKPPTPEVCAARRAT